MTQWPRSQLHPTVVEPVAVNWLRKAVNIGHLYFAFQLIERILVTTKMI